MNDTNKALVLYEFPESLVPEVESYSPFCLKVILALRLAGLSYTSRRNGDPGATRDLNPAGQLPILLVGDEVVCDSTRILGRIERLVPGVFSGGLDARGKAEAWLWEELADTVLNAFLVAARWADARNWRLVREAYFAGAPWFVRRLIAPKIRARVMGRLAAGDVLRAGEAACWERFQLTLDQLEWRAPMRGFWLGASVSRADIALYAQLESLRTPLTEWQRKEVEARPILRAYLDRVRAECLLPGRRVGSGRSREVGTAGAPTLVDPVA